MHAHDSRPEEWSSGNRSEIVTWQTTKTDTSTFHSVQLVNPSSLVETKDQAEDTTTIIAMRSVRLRICRAPPIKFTSLLGT